MAPNERQVNKMRRESLLRLTVLSALVCLAALPLAATNVYVATSNGSFVNYNTATGSYTVLGTSSTELYGLGFNAGVLYANDTNSSPNVGFYTVNPANGALTTVGTISGSTSGTGAIASPIGGGTLYYYDHSDQLFTVNPSNGAATTIGPLGFTVGGSWDISFAPNGQLYATSYGYFLQLDPGTGAGTLLGYSGEEMQCLIPGDGNLYGFSGTSMYSINLTDGALTFVRNTPSALGNFEAGTPFLASPTPEPGTLVLLGSSVLAAAGTLRRKFKA